MKQWNCGKLQQFDSDLCILLVRQWHLCNIIQLLSNHLVEKAQEGENHHLPAHVREEALP